MSKEEWNESELFTQLGRELIHTDLALEELYESDARVLFFQSNKIKSSHGRLILGQCEKVIQKYKQFIDADFIVTLYLPNIQGLDEKRIKVLLLHELLHAGARVDKKGDWQFYIRPHDIEEFSLIKERYGLDWQDPQIAFDFDAGEDKKE